MQMDNSVTVMSKSLVIVHAATATTSGSHCATTGKVIYCSTHLFVFFFFHFGMMNLNNPNRKHQTA